MLSLQKEEETIQLCPHQPMRVIRGGNNRNDLISAAAGRQNSENHHTHTQKKNYNFLILLKILWFDIGRRLGEGK